MVHKPLLLTLLLASFSWSDTGFKSTIQVTETDNAPKCQAGQLKFSAGSVTCNGQTATITSGGGSSTPGGSPNQSIQINNGGLFYGTTNFTLGTSSATFTTQMDGTAAIQLNTPGTSGSGSGVALDFTEGGPDNLICRLLSRDFSATIGNTLDVFCTANGGTSPTGITRFYYGSSNKANFNFGSNTTPSAFFELNQQAMGGSTTRDTFVINPATNLGSTKNILTANNSSGVAVLKVINNNTTYVAGPLGIGTTTPSTDLSFGNQSDRIITVEPSTVASTFGKSVTIQGGTATVAGTDLQGGSVTLKAGGSTGGAVSSILFQAPSVFAGTGPVLAVTAEDVYDDNASGYTAGDIVTLPDSGNGLAQVMIDSVDSVFPGTPLTFHVVTAGSGYSVGDFSSTTGGTGINLAFTITRVSGTGSGTYSTIGSLDLTGLSINGNVTATGTLYAATVFPANGVRQTSSDGFNYLRARTAMGSTYDTFNRVLGLGPQLSVKAFTHGIVIENTGLIYPGFSNFSVGNFAENFQVYGNGDVESLGNLNSFSGGFGRVQNLFTFSETVSNAIWTKSQVVVTDNFIATPNGVIAAAKVATNVTASLKRLTLTSVSLPAGTYTMSCYVGGTTLGDFISMSAITSAGTASFQWSNLPPGGEWTRYKYTFTTTTAGTVAMRFQPLSGQVFYVVGAQLSSGTAAGVYTRTAAVSFSTPTVAMFSNYNILSQGRIGVGVGMSSPTAAGDFVGAAGDAFVLQTSTAVGGPYIFSVSSTTHAEFGGPVPTVATGAGDCGSSPSLVGNDSTGRVTVGSGANGGKCTVTFSNPSWTNIPTCFCQDEVTAVLVRATGTTKTSFACSGVIVAADTLTYRCQGYR